MKKRLPCSGIGGQAVLEGIMMRNKDKYAVAVRTADKEIDCRVGSHKDIAEKNFLARIPFVRGIFKLWDSMVLGIRALTYSSQFVEEEELEPDKFENWLNNKFGEKAEKIIIGFTIFLSAIIAIALFMVLPLFIADIMERNHVITKQTVPVVEGVLKVIIFIVYLMLTALIKDIRRTYMYHGAEHKCINCIETGKELTVENVASSSRFHKRCGTSFLFVIILISIVIFLLVNPANVFLRYGIRILLVPVIAGFAYEFIRLAGSKESKVVDILSKPGLWMQRITTKEPTNDMIEVAIESVEAVFDWEAYLEKNGVEVKGRVRPQAKPQSYVRPTPHDLPKRDNNTGSGFNWKF